MTGVQGQGDGAVAADTRCPDCSMYDCKCPAPPVAGEPSGEDGLAGVGVWRNHDDPVGEWPGIEEWSVEGIGAFLADAEDEFWSTYHRVCEDRGEEAGATIGSLHEALARRILTGPELADRLAAAVEQAKREAWDEGLRAGHREAGDVQRTDDSSHMHSTPNPYRAASVARTGDTT